MRKGRENQGESARFREAWGQPGQRSQEARACQKPEVLRAAVSEAWPRN